VIGPSDPPAYGGPPQEAEISDEDIEDAATDTEASEDVRDDLDQPPAPTTPAVTEG
jgi:hypothetical protein